MRRLARFVALATSISLALLWSGCGYSTDKLTGPVASVAVAAVRPFPGSVTLTAGSTLALDAVPVDARGVAIPDLPVTWSSSDTSVVVVSQTGVALARSPGSARIVAESEGKATTIAITVIPPPVASVSAAPLTASLRVGQTTQLTVTALDGSGGTITGRSVFWSSSNTGVATVSSSGVVTALAQGSATIVAIVEGKNAAALISVQAVAPSSVTVSPVNSSPVIGQTVQLAVTVLDARGNPVTGSPVSWSSSNNSVATVSASGVVTAIATGAATVTATVQGQSASATVDVRAAPVGSIVLTPAIATPFPGGTVQLTSTIKDVNGNPMTGLTVAWTSSDRAIATVSSSGLVTALTRGTATITATVQGLSSSAIVDVQPLPVASVTASPSSSALTTGQTVQLSAAVRDAQGNPASQLLSWSSSDSRVATVSAGGLVTAVGAGSATIIATAGGQSGAAAITVTTPPPPPPDPTPQPPSTPPPAPPPPPSTAPTSAELPRVLLDTRYIRPTGRTIFVDAP
ncbi:MAG: Ig-like domain-containing protein [Gemmatimonadaceae bacterium]